MNTNEYGENCPACLTKMEREDTPTHFRLACECGWATDYWPKSVTIATIE